MGAETRNWERTFTPIAIVLETLEMNSSKFIQLLGKDFYKCEHKGSKIESILQEAA